MGAQWTGEDNTSLVLAARLAPRGSTVCKLHLSSAPFKQFPLPPAHPEWLPEDICSLLTRSCNEPVPRGSWWWLWQISCIKHSPSGVKGVTARAEIFLQRKMKLRRKVRKEVKGRYKG